MNTTIRNIGLKEYLDLDIRCAHCHFWFERSDKNYTASGSILNIIKSKLYYRARFRKGDLECFYRYGGKIKAAFTGDSIAGIIIYGKPYLFPGVKSFKIYPPDPEATFIGCIFVKSQHRKMFIGQRLLLSLEQDMIKKRVKALEIIGQRNTVQEQKTAMVPIGFLIKNGFYIKKNDSRYPLMRLDIQSMAFDFKLQEVLKKAVLINKRVEVPGRLYNG